MVLHTLLPPLLSRVSPAGSIVVGNLEWGMSFVRSVHVCRLVRDGTSNQKRIEMATSGCVSRQRNTVASWFLEGGGNVVSVLYNLKKG